MLQSSVHLVQEVRAATDHTKLQYWYKLNSVGPNPNVVPKKPAQVAGVKSTLRSLQSDFFLIKHPFLTRQNCHRVMGSLPHLLNTFERACLLKDINK